MLLSGSLAGGSCFVFLNSDPFLSFPEFRYQVGNGFRGKNTFDFFSCRAQFLMHAAGISRITGSGAYYAVIKYILPVYRMDLCPLPEGSVTLPDTRRRLVSLYRYANIEAP